MMSGAGPDSLMAYGFPQNHGDISAIRAGGFGRASDMRSPWKGPLGVQQVSIGDDQVHSYIPERMAIGQARWTPLSRHEKGQT